MRDRDGEVRIVVVAQSEPRLHGVCVMVGEFLDALRRVEGLAVTHVEKRLSTAMAEVERFRWVKLYRATRLLLSAAWALVGKRPHRIVLTPSPRGAHTVFDAALALLARCAGVPWVTYLHGSGWRDTVSRGGLTGRALSWVLEGAAEVVHLHERLVGDLPESVRGRTIILPNCVEVKALKSVQSERAGGGGRGLRVLFLSNLLRNKGVLDALDCVLRLRERGCDIALTIAGRRADESVVRDIERRIAERDAFDAVTVVGPVEGDRKRRLLLRHDVLLFPSMREAFPLVVLEALATGTAVHAYDVGCVRAVIEDLPGCGVVPVGALDRLAAGLAAAEKEFPLDEPSVARLWRRASEFSRERFREAVAKLAQREWLASQ